jgi:superfamily I DNA and/or RNA helicase
MTEPLSLLPLAVSGACRLLLVGDPRQLPPTLANSKPRANHEQLDRTLFDRLLHLGHPCTMLRTQYRCHPLISNICNHLFYENKLLNGIEAAARKSSVPYLPTIAAVNSCSLEERVGDSYTNGVEAVIIKELVLLLAERRTPGHSISIGVVCLYKSQVRVVQGLLASLTFDADVDILCNTVDAFQGSEKSVVIISTCRTSLSNSNDFVTNAARVNVAFSRARNNLIIVGNIDVLLKLDLWSHALASAVKFRSTTALAEHLQRCLLQPPVAAIAASTSAAIAPLVEAAMAPYVDPRKAPVGVADGMEETSHAAPRKAPVGVADGREEVVPDPYPAVWSGIGYAPLSQELKIVKRKQPLFLSSQM